MHQDNTSEGTSQSLLYWFEVSYNARQHITCTAILLAAKYRGGVNYNYLTISFLHQLVYIHHVPHNNHLHHPPNIVRSEGKVSFTIAVLTNVGFISTLQGYCGLSLCSIL